MPPARVPLPIDGVAAAHPFAGFVAETYARGRGRAVPDVRAQRAEEHVRAPGEAAAAQRHLPDGACDALLPDGGDALVDLLTQSHVITRTRQQSHVTFSTRAL